MGTITLTDTQKAALMSCSLFNLAEAERNGLVITAGPNFESIARARVEAERETAKVIAEADAATARFMAGQRAEARTRAEKRAEQRARNEAHRETQSIGIRSI
jgi:hypothetical protein